MTIQLISTAKGLSKKRKVEVTVAAAFALALTGLSLILLQVRSISMVFAVGYFSLFFLAAIIASLEYVLFDESKGDKIDVRLTIRLVLFAVLGGLILEIGTLFGSPFYSVLSVGDWSLIRVAIFTCISYMAELGIVLLSRYFKNRASVKLGRRQVVSLLVIIAVSLVVGAVIGWIASTPLSLSAQPVAVFFALAVACLCVLVYLFNNAPSPEKIFLCIALSAGIGIAVIPPAQMGISWDDQIHYARSLALSYVYDAKYSEADSALINLAYRAGDWSEPSLNKYASQLDEMSLKDAIDEPLGFTVSGPESTTLMTTSTVGYIPAAVGLWLGRLLHLPIHWTVVLGRLTSLLSFCSIAYLAIKLIPIRKTVMSCIALLPTALFLEASFSYDPWVFSLLLLAVALIVKESLSLTKITGARWAQIALVLFAAMGPKAIYFPLFGLILLIPKSKFETTAQRRVFVASFVILMLITVLSFCVPFLSSVSTDAVTGDLRGGSGVNSGNQVQYILSNGLEYATTLLSFLTGFLSISETGGYTVFWAYLGGLSGALTLLPFAILLVASMLDSNAESSKLSKVANNVWAGVLFFLTVVLISTALYISFTPVGLDTINGVSHRYLLPLLFVVFGLMLNLKVSYMGNQRAMRFALPSMQGLLGFVCLWSLVVLKMI